MCSWSLTVQIHMSVVDSSCKNCARSLCFWWAVLGSGAVRVGWSVWVPASCCSRDGEHFYDVRSWVVSPHDPRTPWATCVTWRSSTEGYRRGEAWWTSTQAHHQVEIIKVVWKSRTSPSLSWNISSGHEVIRQPGTSPSPDKEFLPITIWRAGGQGLDVCRLFVQYSCVFSIYKS